MKQDLYKTEAPAQDPGAVKYRHTLKSGRVVLETYGGHLLVSAPGVDIFPVSLTPEEASALGSIARKGGHLPPVMRAAKEYETECAKHAGDDNDAIRHLYSFSPQVRASWGERG